MAREYAIPSSSTFIDDYGLTVTPTPANINRRVVIIGTAEDGPMYEPIKIDKLEDSELVWGRQTKGDLVRGAYEAWGAQESGTPNIVGVRIGNGKKASLTIGEMSGAGVDAKQASDAISSLKLVATYPGGIYNQVSIKRDDYNNIVMYNPKNGSSTKFTANIRNPNDSTVNVHNVKELVDAINADRNMSTVVKASFDELQAAFELEIGTNPAYYDTTTGTLQLQGIFTEDTCPIKDKATNAFAYPVPKVAYQTSAIGADWKTLVGGVEFRTKASTVSNNIIALTNVEKIGISGAITYTPTGKSIFVDVPTLDGKGNGFSTILALTSATTVGPSISNSKSEVIYKISNMLVNEVPTSGDETKLTFSTPLQIDDTATAGTSSYLSATLGALLDYSYIPTFAAYNKTATAATKAALDALPGDLTTIYTVAGKTYRCKSIATTSPVAAAVYEEVTGFTGFGYSSHANKAVNLPSDLGTIKITVSKVVDPNGSFVDVTKAFTITAYDAIKDILDITPNVSEVCVGGVNTGAIKPEYDSILNKNGTTGILIDADLYFRLTGYTIKSVIAETQTLSALDAITDNDLTSYFVRGQEIVFNRTPAFEMIFNYGTRVAYEVDVDVNLADAFKGKISFSNPLNRPKVGERILCNYTYMPNFPLIVSATQTLNSGTNGVNLSVKEREAELRKAYSYLKEFDATFWVPMGAHIDAIKTDFNKSTGKSEAITNSFAIDIKDFLEELSINSLQPHALLGVTQIPGDTLGERDDWVDNLTNFDINATNRAANVMMGIQSYFMSVITFEPIFLNTGRGRPYSANGQAAYAGYLASIPYDVSPTNKGIPNVRALRKEFSMSQLERLTGMRYVPMRTKNGKPVVVNDITAAPYGSDFVNWTNYSITAEASDRVKQIADGYIGQPNSIHVRASLEHDISQTLSAMTGLQAFNFTINSTMDQQILGVVEIDMILVPVFTMKKIRTSVKLRKNLPSN